MTKKILLILIKNTSPLDYGVPLLWEIKRSYPTAKVSVLYCVLNRKKILRKSRLYSDILSENGIAEYDFADFLPAPYAAWKGLWRRLCAKSDWDSAPLPRSSRRVPLAKPLARNLQRLLNVWERFLMRRVDTVHILPTLNPDLILFDNRTITQFHGRDDFYAYFGQVQKPVVLLPHAPHHTGTTTLTPFDERGEKLPAYCDYWMPFINDRSWVNLPDQKDQFAYIGYPGLDSRWLTWLQSRHDATKRRADGPLRCLFIIRKFLNKGQPRPPGHDAYIFDYEEFAYYLSLVSTAFQSSDVEIELVVKPHPSNDFEMLREILAGFHIPRWRIFEDPIYAALPGCDFVISLYSTTLLIPAMVGIPVVLLHSRIQDEIHQWAEMKQMYSGLRFYLENPEDLPNQLKEVIDLVRYRRRGETPAWDQDVRHLRAFYPDGASLRAMKRLGLNKER